MESQGNIEKSDHSVSNGENLLQARRLTPENTRIFRGTFNLLHVTVKDEGLYRAVFAVQAFPVSSPKRFIFLYYYDLKDRQTEIGMIENLDIFPPETKALVLEALAKHYFAYEIKAIHDIRWEFGVLFFNVETDKGPKKFYMRWLHHRAEDYGEKGKILLDVFDDRYIIPDVSALSPMEKDLFTRFIYW
ncbi:MAG TPA: DUF1854 domain-containing protein [bacterium]|nr:DUF1854 domain-containing protein [bacterium]HPP12004.1 DUF1854 domain-containing protein [bacterium]